MSQAGIEVTRDKRTFHFQKPFGCAFPELTQQDVAKIHSREDCDAVLVRIRDIADANYIAPFKSQSYSSSSSRRSGGHNAFNRNA